MNNYYTYVSYEPGEWKVFTIRSHLGGMGISLFVVLTKKKKTYGTN